MRRHEDRCQWSALESCAVGWIEKRWRWITDRWTGWAHCSRSSLSWARSRSRSGGSCVVRGCHRNGAMCRSGWPGSAHSPCSVPCTSPPASGVAQEERRALEADRRAAAKGREAANAERQARPSYACSRRPRPWRIGPTVQPALVGRRALATAGVRTQPQPTETDLGSPLCQRAPECAADQRQSSRLEKLRPPSIVICRRYPLP